MTTRKKRVTLPAPGSTRAWGGPPVALARAYIAAQLPSPCGQCGETVKPDDAFVVGHIKSRGAHPELTWTPANWRPEHRKCSDRTGQKGVIDKARQEILQELTAKGVVFPADEDPESRRPVSGHIHSEPMEPVSVRDELVWTHERLSKHAWMEPFLDVPEDASVPLAMTPPHPEAVGSYGAEAIAWVKAELGVDLRFWQRLAFTRQLEHRADGSLCWRIILESGPRRIGKSVRLRSMALWRLAHADLFGEKQLALHTGKDLPIVREIHRQAWRWAQEREGWDVKRGVGQEEVYRDEDRWLVRSTDSVYGYDVCLGMVDEAWAVDPATFDEGLEPATMERISPQLLLTSTAHRRATSLMKKRIADALAFEDGETLLLLWGVLDGSDAGNPEVWRAASPHWSEDRRKMIAAKYEKAINGEVDPLSGDPDPMESFLGQYLCRWDMRPSTGRTVGDEVVSESAWAELAHAVDQSPPDAVAVEAWFDRGVSLAQAWRATDGTVTVSVADYATLDELAHAVGTLDLRRPVIVGTSLLEHPAWKANRVRTTSAAATTLTQVGELQRMLREGTLRHDGGEHLTGQVLELRVSPGANGPRLRSTGRGDAVKAATWAASAAASRVPTGKPRILTARPRSA